MAKSSPRVASPQGQSKRKWWLVGAIAVTSAFGGGLLAVVTDIGALPGKAFKISEQVGPKIEEAVGPAAIRVIDVHRLSGSPGDVLLPADPAQKNAALNDPARTTDRAEWKDRYNMISVGDVTWEIGLETFRDERVEIINMTPVLDGGSCSRPLGGMLFQNGNAGSIDMIRLSVDIDSPQPVFMTQLDRNDPPVPYFQYRVIGLEKGKRDTIVLIARATNGYCRWRIKAEYYAAGARRELLLSRPDGSPFELTAPLDRIELYDTVVPDPLVCRDKKPQPVPGKDYAAAIKNSDPGVVPSVGCK